MPRLIRWPRLRSTGRQDCECVIDSAQTRINFDATGKITTPLDTGFKTKNELGANTV